MRTNATLPPGQREIETFPRFGLTPFATRFPTAIGTAKIEIVGDVRTSVEVGIELERIARVEQCSDFHCVTTWTRKALQWSGVRFSDFYQQIVVPIAGAPADATFVVLRGQDGARSSPQAVIATFPSMEIYVRGGGYVGFGAVQKSDQVGMGAWRHVGGRNYTSEYQFFGYAPAPVGAPDGAPDGTFLKVSSAIRLNVAGTRFTSTTTANVVDAAGNVLTRICGTRHATRLQ